MNFFKLLILSVLIPCFTFGGSPIIFGPTGPTSLANGGVMFPDGSLVKDSGNSNKIRNGTAENGLTTGYSTYDDGASASPVDGTGGATITSTIGVSATTPLEGAKSFIFTKSAANYQGEGFSYAFSIDSKDQAKMIRGSFDYAIASGTYADDEMQMWIYDVTNAALIPVTPFKIKNHSLTSDTHSFEFQSAYNSTSYRLIWHIAGTSASAYTLKIDNIQVGPQVARVYGSNITDWVSFTPTGSWTTNTTYSGRWKKNGDTMDVDVLVATSGAPTSATLTVNLPSGYVIDTTKLISTSTELTLRNSSGRVNDSGSAVYQIQPRYNNTTSVVLINLGASGTYVNQPSVVDQATPITFGAGDYVSASFSVPIVGWSSQSQIISTDAAQGPIATYVYKAADQTGVNPNNSAVKITFDTSTTSPAYDTNGAWDSANNRYLVKVPGKYDISQLAVLSGTNVLNNLYQLRLYKNGAFLTAIDEVTPPANTRTALSGTITVDAVAGDYFETYLNGAGNNSASTLTLLNASNTAFFNVKLNQAASQILASADVSALYNGQPTGTLNSSFNITTFPTKIKDSHGAYSSGSYTVPTSGTYDISAAALLNATYSLGNYIAMAIFVDGVEKITNTDYAAGATGSFTARVNVKAYPLLSGQVVTIRTASQGTSPTYNTSVPNSYFSVVKSGNY